MRALVAALALVLVTTSVAAALPGQSRKAVCTWAKASDDLRDVNCAMGGSEGTNDFVFGYIRYPDVTIPGRAPNDNVLTFEAHPDRKGKIATEIIHYHHLPDVPSMTLGRKGSEMLAVIRHLYGDAIANDFATSQHVKHAPGSDAYRGKRFLYITTTVRQNVIGADTAHSVAIDDGLIVRPAASSPSELGY